MFNMLHVDKVDSLQAEPVHITVSGLEEKTCYKLRMLYHHVFGTHFSYGIFQSDYFGVIDLATDEPIRGTYQGVDQMGLFGSMIPSRNVRKGGLVGFAKSDPWYYHLQLINSSEEVLDEVTLKKHILHPLFTREEVRIPEEKLFGSLFIPPGPGPFPCILDFPGASPIIMEGTAAMLASEGFIVLTFIAFEQFEELPKRMCDVEVEYLMKTIDYILSHPKSNGKLGMYGMSFGAVLANFMATKSSKINAIINVNSFASFSKEDMVIRENGELVPSSKLDEGQSVFINETLKMLPSSTAFSENLSKDHKIPWSKIGRDVPFRLVGTLDDWVVDDLMSVRAAQQDLKQLGFSVEVDLVPGGHDIRPPYYPHHDLMYNKYLRMYWGLGGDTVPHYKTQETMWKKNIEFFKKHLGTGPEIPDWNRETKVVAAKTNIEFNSRL